MNNLSKIEMRDGYLLGVRTDQTISLVIDRAVYELERRGFFDEAKKIRGEYDLTFKNYIQLQFHMSDIGDHKPLIEWLGGVLVILRLTLGDFIMEQTHLMDLYILVFAIPVVFDPTNKEWDRAEYKLHFSPFSGVITYWLSWATCEACGGVGLPLACSVLAGGLKLIVKDFIAPGVGGWIYDTANRQGKARYFAPHSFSAARDLCAAR